MIGHVKGGDIDAACHEPRGLHHLRRHRLGRHAGSQPACAALAQSRSPTAAIDAAKAGAAIVHCHVRDPETGKPRRDVALYREVTERIRDADVDVVLNLTAGMGGDMVFGPAESPLPLKEQGTDMGGATNRVEHVQAVPAGDLHARLRHDEFQRSRLCDDQHARHAARHGRHDDRRWASSRRSRSSTPAICWFAKQLVSEGVLKTRALVQLCMGMPWGAPDDLNTFMAMVNNVPPDWIWSAFSLGRNQMAYVAAAVLAGGNVRVGLEDNLWLDKGVLATNAQLVERAVTIVENMGARVIGPDEVRKKLKLTKRAPLAA